MNGDITVVRSNATDDIIIEVRTEDNQVVSCRVSPSDFTRAITGRACVPAQVVVKDRK